MIKIRQTKWIYVSHDTCEHNAGADSLLCCTTMTGSQCVSLKLNALYIFT